MLNQIDWTQRLTEKGLDYLKKYGYLKVGFGDEDIEPALNLFKEFLLSPEKRFRNVESPEFAQLFLATISQGRCDVPDFEDGHVFIPEGSLLSRDKMKAVKGNEVDVSLTAISYKVDYGHLPSNLKAKAVAAVILQAFTEGWQSILVRGASIFEFREIGSGKADITLGWTRIDGIGNKIGGEASGGIQFDIEDPWSTAGGLASYDVETVAMHEIGHALGLGHLGLGNSTPVMYPIFSLEEGSRRLNNDDIMEFLMRYGQVSVSQGRASRQSNSRREPK